MMISPNGYVDAEIKGKKEEERKDADFNEKLKDVVGIKVRYGGYLLGTEERYLMFDGDRICTERDFYNRIPPTLEEYTENFYEDITREDLLSELASIHMGEWEDEYVDDCVLDGIQWSVAIEYKDGQKRQFNGSKRFPYNFYDFLDIMRIDCGEDKEI